MKTLIGQQIGKYRLETVLGSGGMAQVYRARQLPLERDVAVKVLHAHMTEQESFRKRFLREAKAVASMQHPNIVQIYDFDYNDAEGICYMAMEFLDGMSLEDQLMASQIDDNSHHPLPIAEAVDIVINVAQALGFAHEQDIVHRDVKPANIMGRSDGRTVLTDFGIATILNQTRMTVEGATSGTPSYMSPEQALGERGDARSDLYSLGAVLYQLVTGRLPFEADTLYGLIMKHVNEPPPPASSVNPDVPPVIEQVINKAMAKDPDHRYQTAQEMIADLEAFQRGDPVEVTQLAPAAPNFWEKFTRQPQNAVWGVAAVVALLLLGGYVFSMSQPEEASNEIVNSMVSDSSGVGGVGSMTSDTGSMTATQDFFEPFEDNSMGWLMSEGEVARQLAAESYQIAVNEPDRAVASYPDDSFQFEDFSYEAEGILLDGQPESGYGLVFRRMDDQNYYVFAINGMRQWSIWRLEDGTWYELRNLPNGETWTTSTLVAPQGEMNRLRVEANGPNLSLFINGEPLLDEPLVDETFSEGGIGFYVASSRTAGDSAFAEASFDNALVTPFN